MGRGMGGGAPFPYPKWVWSPSGGWYCHYPPNWKRNTALVVAGWAAILTLATRWSWNNERARMPPPDNMYPTPSQYYRSHAAEDDPRVSRDGLQ